MTEVAGVWYWKMWSHQAPSSVLETVSSRQDVGVVVKHVVAIVDREQGTESTLTNAGLVFHRYNYNFGWARDYLRVTKVC